MSDPSQGRFPGPAQFTPPVARQTASSHPTSPHLTSPHLTSPHLTRVGCSPPPPPLAPPEIDKTTK